MQEHQASIAGGESGNILVVTLVILFAISVIGATMAMVSSMDLKIAGNRAVDDAGASRGGGRHERGDSSALAARIRRT